MREVEEHAARGGRERADAEGAVAHAALDQQDRPHRTAIRVSFEKVGAEWKPVAAPPSRLSWTICHDGRRLAALDSHLPEPPREDLRFLTAHEVAPGQQVPFVGTPSMEFAGWMGSEVFRPMALTSGPSCGDPEHWRPAEPPAAVVEHLITALREVEKGIHDCDVRGSPRAYRFPDTDVRAVQGFVSDPGARIVSLAIRLPEDLAARCGVLTAAGWQPHTFAVLPGGEVAHLGFGLTFVDAGDYDGDGHSEVLFQSSSYDADGYTLAYDSLRKSAHLDWSYH